MKNRLPSLLSVLRAPERRALVVVLAATACAGDTFDAPPDEAGELGQLGQALAAYDLESQSWELRPMPLYVCTRLTNGDDGTLLSMETFDTYKRWALEALIAAWDPVPGIQVRDGGNCSVSPEGWLAIAFAPHEYGDGNCSPWSDCRIRGPKVPGPDVELQIRASAIHEFGHALGFYHEHQRLDRTLCPEEQAKLDRCEDCVEGVVMCSAEEVNGCAAVFANNAINETVDPLTVYDPVSVMSYCGAHYGRAPDDIMPTALDLLGAEMLYADDRVYPVACSRNCYRTASGAIVRTDGVLTTDWNARGGYDVRFENGSKTLGVSALPNGSSTLSFRFRHQYGALRNGGGTIIKSNAYHTAMLMSVSL